MQRLKAERNWRKCKGTGADRKSRGMDSQEMGKTHETNWYGRRGPQGNNRELRSLGGTG